MKKGLHKLLEKRNISKTPRHQITSVRQHGYVCSSLLSNTSDNMYKPKAQLSEGLAFKNRGRQLGLSIGFIWSWKLDCNTFKQSWYNHNSNAHPNLNFICLKQDTNIKVVQKFNLISERTQQTQIDSPSKGSYILFDYSIT